jgi:hypothetical protein
MRVQVTDKRKLTLKFTPTNRYSQSWKLCIQKYIKRADGIKSKLEKYFACLERIQSEFDAFKSNNTGNEAENTESQNADDGN